MQLFKNRPIEEFPIGNIPLADHQAALAKDGIRFHPHAWISPPELDQLAPDGPRTLIDARKTPLAWLGDYPDPDKAVTATDSFLIVHSWDLLHANELHVNALSESSVEGDVHPHAVIEGCVRIGKGSRILPGVYIEGNAIIGENCKIGPNCYLRGNTSIGDKCHIGQSVEIKNSILLNGTNVGHLSYVGDSILGEEVNFGAGTTTANLRHDGRTHRTMVNGSLMDTGRRKFGCVVGDGVHTGINTSIYPGRKLYPGTSTRPGEIVRHDIHKS